LYNAPSAIFGILLFNNIYQSVVLEFSI
jgi:hypothetical protein